jgi:tetratricopeptide (TPR) repeat protein
LNGQTAQEFYNNAAEELINLNYSGAIQSLTKAIEKKPTFSDAFYLRGKTFSEIEDCKMAIKDFDKALELGYKDLIFLYYEKIFL